VYAEGDKVEVLDPLPIPLTVHLGNGSDKFLGNDEDDTCYAEGAKRNRCYGYGRRRRLHYPAPATAIASGARSTTTAGTAPAAMDAGEVRDGTSATWARGPTGVTVTAKTHCLYEGAGSGQLYGGPGVDCCDGGPGKGQSHSCEKGPGA
jgi:hypothetical protein